MEPYLRRKRNGREAICIDFLTKYGNGKETPFLYEPKEPTEVRDIDPEHLYQPLVHSNRNSGGLDGWTPEDLTLISRSACALICQMLIQIEVGIMQWPKPVLTARAALMAKDSTKMEEALI